MFMLLCSLFNFDEQISLVTETFFSSFAFLLKLNLICVQTPMKESPMSSQH